ncbi:glycosyltransferase [bacterium]|nr:glycosyltransferase [bacterium]
MKIAHVAVVTPNRCGLYETTRELVSAERKLGHDARIVDPQPIKGIYPGDNTVDRGADIATKDFVFEADVVINHSGMDGELDKATAPVIYMSHGRPYSSFIGERNGGAPIYSYHIRKDESKRFKAVVTLWEEHVPFLNVVYTNTPVYSINPTVDLEIWTPVGPSGYGFHGKKGNTNLVITDPWRDDIDPYLSIQSALLFCRNWKDAKVHIYGADENRKGFESLFYLLEREGYLGEVCGWTKGLDHVYRAADVMVTPHRIATRSVREAMASGCQVVTARDCDPYDIESTARVIAHKLTYPSDTRTTATQLFSPETAVRSLLEICDKYVSKLEPV